MRPLLEILNLIARGLTNREIGTELRIAEKTVRNRVSGILMKLGFTRRTQAAAWALRRNLLLPEQV